VIEPAGGRTHLTGAAQAGLAAALHVEVGSEQRLVGDYVNDHGQIVEPDIEG
jgi:hypothetical protein